MAFYLVSISVLIFSVFQQNDEEEGGCDEDDDHDEEIFDDDDFYHQLLRDLIEKKSSSAGEGDLGQKWLQIQKLRSKSKKKVDRRSDHKLNFLSFAFFKSSLNEPSSRLRRILF